jgi:hypothetical protein
MSFEVAALTQEGLTSKPARLPVKPALIYALTRDAATLCNRARQRGDRRFAARSVAGNPHLRPRSPRLAPEAGALQGAGSKHC